MKPEINRYFESAPENRQERLKILHSLILDLFPDAVVDLKYKMPTYTQGGGWVAVGNQKHYVSLYTCAYSHIEAFSRKHPSIKTGKGCINFRDANELPLEDIRKVVKQAILNPGPSAG